MNSIGVQLDHLRLKSRVVEWSTIGHATYSRITGKCIILGTSGRRLLAVRAFDLGGRAMSRECAAEVNIHAEIYSKDNPEATP